MGGVLENYVWAVVVGGIVCFIMGFGIGANDVANNFGSSVGSRAIKLWAAVIIAAICEFIGAVGFGSSVTDSVRAGVIDFTIFQDQPDILIYANLCALIAAAAWLLLASKFGYPVSTTHSIIGALIGVGVATGHANAVDWGYVGGVVASWIVSPLLASIVGMLFFGSCRAIILRRNDPVKVAFRCLWALVFVECFIFSLFFLVSSPLILDGVACPYPDDAGNWSDHQPCRVSKWVDAHYGLTTAIAVIGGVVGCMILSPFLYWFLIRKMKHWDMKVEKSIQAKSLSQADVESQQQIVVSVVSVASHGAEPPPEAKASLEIVKSEVSSKWIDDSSESLNFKQKLKQRWRDMPWFQDLVGDALAEDEKAANIHGNAEIFNQRTEKFFSFLQILSAIIACIVHGSNDVANATAPFATIYSVQQLGMFSEEVACPIWILALGGMAISVGLAFLGHHVIKSIGVKLSKITPSRGFCIEMAMATVMIFGSMGGLPLSTTHCQIGATIGVGLIDRSTDHVGTWKNCYYFEWKAVNWKLMGKVAIAWVATLIVAGVGAALIFAFGVWGPTLQLEYYTYNGP